ncbi:MFS transporter [Leifsonia sp. McL0607]|uniref:MFS transporter n=1 Tax=Leifsonia sp. McL0607 TaxID=3415672 RepID=UPI003CEA4703
MTYRRDLLRENVKNSSNLANAFASLREHRSVTFAVLIDTVGAGLTLPLSIVYFTLTTNVPLGVIGALATAAALAALPIGFLGGFLTDWFGARSSMVLNNLLSAAGYGLYLIAHEPIGIFVAILFANASERLYWSAWTAYVHDLSGGQSFERWFAFLEATKSIALGVGAIAAVVVLAGDQRALSWLILLNILTSVVAAAVFAVQKVGSHSRRMAREHSSGEVSSWREFVLDPAMRLITIGQFLIGPAMVLPNIALSVLFVQLWHMPAVAAPVQFAISTAVSAVAQTTITRAVRGRNRGSLIAVGASLTAITVLSLVVLPKLSGVGAWAYLVCAAIALAVANILYLPSTNAVMAEAPPARIRGRAIGVFQTSSSIGMALYPMSIGLLETGQPWTLWALTSGVFIAAGIVWRAAVQRLPQRVQVAIPAET